MNTKTIAGIDFEAVRQLAPYPHWRAKVVATGYLYEAGVFKSQSKPKLWASIEETARIRDRLDSSPGRFAHECLTAHLPKARELWRRELIEAEPDANINQHGHDDRGDN